MATFITNFEVIPADEEEISRYYERAANKINGLLKQYNIRNAKGEFEYVSTHTLKALLSFTRFFQSTPIKSIFFDQKQSYVPHEIIQAFRGIISNPPANIKIVFFNEFLKLLLKKGWDELLSEYFEKQYHVPSNGTIILDELEDYSVGVGVYRVTFQLRAPGREKVTVFLKKSSSVQSCNELLYCRLQKYFLPTASFVKMPFILSNKNNDEKILLSPLIPGVASDAVLSTLVLTHRNTFHHYHKQILRKALEILIEAFLSHSALGDLMGRNDRHLMNSQFALVVDGAIQTNSWNQLETSTETLTYANIILSNKMDAISLIDFDLAWLLEETNVGWILADIDFGLSELNLLSLLDEFNDYDIKTNPFFEKRKKYIEHYFNVYCRRRDAIIQKKELIFSEIVKCFPTKISDEKLKILNQNIALLEGRNEFVVKLFERYLLNFRLRSVHKETLAALHKMAVQSNHQDCLNALEEAELLKYLPFHSASSNPSVFLELQCFRGILSKKDILVLSKQDRLPWETIAANITRITEKFSPKLLKALHNKQQFIRHDAAQLLKVISSEKTTFVL